MISLFPFKMIVIKPQIYLISNLKEYLSYTTFTHLISIVKRINFF